MTSKQTLGVRLNNPGNIEWGSPWEGLVPRHESQYATSSNSQQRRFCEFVDPAYGIRAIARTLITYADKRKAKNGSAIDTVTEVIERWAPSFENNVSAYASHVGKIMGVSALETIDIKQYEVMKGLVVGIIAHENAGFAYPDSVVEEGLRRAGLVPAKAIQNNVPLTKETGSAAAMGLVGVTALAPVLPEVIKAISENKADLASGDWKLVLIGVASVLAASVVAWAQYKRREAGSL